jgi:hypothetical protein
VQGLRSVPTAFENSVDRAAIEFEDGIIESAGVQCAGGYGPTPFLGGWHTATLDKKRRQRFQFMEAVYQATQGDRFKFTDLNAIAPAIGLSHEEADSVAQYLVDERLLKWQAFGGVIGITHEGVNEVEQALAHREQPTVHFPPVNVIHIEHMTQSQIQQGTVGSVQQIVQATTPDESEAVKRFLTSLQNVKRELKLTADSEAEFDAQVATMESQMKSARPKRAILKEAGVAVLDILASAPGREAVEEVLKHVPGWFHQ